MGDYKKDENDDYHLPLRHRLQAHEKTQSPTGLRNFTLFFPYNFDIIQK